LITSIRSGDHAKLLATEGDYFQDSDFHDGEDEAAGGKKSKKKEKKVTYKDVIRKGIMDKIDHLDESGDDGSDDSGDGSEDSGSNRKKHSKGSIF